ncbi:S8 family serine peptidase [Peredibacter sp. HCB2-198]|uniref:S8 family serine peptidase n=1 Tax=Peredibacter sp. HCB2-198 TaxID=3383025 RepID=UPI0038B57ECA
MKWISLCVLAAMVAQANAATIAVIDSGLDYKHEMIVPNLWTNAGEVEDRRDNDGNGYQDDVHGWNFAEQNGNIIDYSYLGTFSPDCSKYFDIQGKMFLGQATESEIAWLKEKVKDPNFIKEMGKFGNFVHGTHVAGISIRNTQNKAMGIKLIPTEVKPFLDGLARTKAYQADRWSLLEKAFDALAAEQMKMLTDIARFAAYHKADVANGSFGTGFNQAKMITDNAYRIIFFKKPSEEDSNRAAAMFIAAMVKHGQNFVAAAPNTLFVFAAGNDGMSNDQFGTSPANIKADNVITVGATYKNEFFAPFSNYGTKMVDIAAPGMLIHSAIPGNEYLKVSGTSQASPYVANVAAQIKEANPRLKPVEIKKILMGTVDPKGFLADKVATGGIVNSERAVVAAQMTNSMSVSEAISRAKSAVKAPVALRTERVFPFSVVPMPLTPMFK